MPFRALVAALVAALATVAGLAASPLAAQQAPPDYAAAMHAAHGSETPSASRAARIQPRTAVTSEVVTYGTLDGKALKGVLARPSGTKGGPALIVIHEWWGLNDNIKAVAARYAGEGYTVLAVDLFGTTASTPDSAMKLYQAAMRNVPAGERNVAAAIAWLKQAGATSIGAVGYCFGGHWSLRTGLVGGTDVKAVAIYYGAPITDAGALARLKAPVVGFYGALDTGIPVDSVRRMQSVLTGSGRTMTMHVYDGANHAFANPSGRAYDAKAADDAWGKALAFFKANLR